MAAEHQYETRTTKSTSSSAPSGGLTKANAQLIDQIIAERSKNSKFEFFRENTRLKPPDEPVVRKQKITRSRTNSETEDLYQDFRPPQPVKPKKDPYKEFVGSHASGPVWEHLDRNARSGTRENGYRPTERFNPRQVGQSLPPVSRTPSRSSGRPSGRNKGAKLDPFAAFVNSIAGDNPVNRVENFPNRVPSPVRRPVQQQPPRVQRSQMNGAREQPRRQKLIDDDEPSAPSSAFNNAYYKKKDKKEVKNEKGAAFAAFLDRHTDEQPAWKHLDSQSALKMMGDDAKRDINKMLPLMGDINGYTEDQDAPEEYNSKRSKHPKGNAFAAFVNSISEGQPVNIAGQSKVDDMKPRRAPKEQRPKKKKDAFSEFVNSHTDGPLFASGTSGGTSVDLEAIKRFDSTSSLNSSQSERKEKPTRSTKAQGRTSKKDQKASKKSSRRNGDERAPRRKKKDAFAEFVGQHTDGPLFKPEVGKSALEMKGLNEKDPLKISRTLEAVQRFDAEVGTQLTRVPDEHQPGDPLPQKNKPVPKPEKKLTQKAAQPGLYSSKGGAFQDFVNSALGGDKDDNDNQFQEPPQEKEPEERILSSFTCLPEII